MDFGSQGDGAALALYKADVNPNDSTFFETTKMKLPSATASLLKIN